MNLTCSLSTLMAFVVVTTLNAVETSSTTPVTPVATVDTTAIKLLPGDQIHIEVYDNPDLSQTLRVSPEHTSFPQLNDIGSLVGMTPAGVRDLLMQRLTAGIIRHPQVTVEVTALAERAIAVLGAVRNPQRITITPFSRLSALHAVAEAGGMLDEAARSQLALLRRQPGDSPGSPPIMQLTLIDAEAASVSDPVLENGDTLFVPRLDRVFVLGEVARPGPLLLGSDKPLTVAQAISSAGGFTRAARAGKVRLLRGTQMQTFDVAALLAGTLQEDPPLLPGDVVFVPESIF